MSKITKRKFICNGCGKDRPCMLETNQEINSLSFDDQLEDLKCVLDETNQSHDWKEIVSSKDTPKQVTYIIVNDKGQMCAGITGSHSLWTELITQVMFFDNAHLANRYNSNFKLRQKVMRMRYNLEEVIY